ncbi:MAG: hypothetical protein ACT443_00985, partial [Gemmatimonadota bacterium]
MNTSLATRAAEYWRRITSLFALLPLHQQLVIAGIMVGSGAGLSVFVFETLLRLFGAVGAGASANIPARMHVIATLLVPALGGLIA